MKITTKEDFTRLSQRGLLGNYLRSWATLQDLEASGYRGWVTIRSRDKQSPHFVPWAFVGLLDRGMFVDKEWITFPSTYNARRDLLDKGAKLEGLYFQEVPSPVAHRPIQFEALPGPQWQGAGFGIELFYETATNNPLRDIRERCKTADGVTAQSLLRYCLDPCGYDTLMDIWDRYPTATIEATQFSEPTGAFHQRLVVWEVRDY